MLSPSLMIAGGAFLAGLAAGGGAAWWHYSPRLELANQRAEAMGDKVREQNRAVEALKEASDKRVAEAEKAAERARGAAEAHRAAAARIMSQQLAAGADACVSACRLIDDEVSP